MALAVASSACGPSFALSRSRATRQHAAQAPAAGTRKAASRVLVAPRAFYTTGRSGYYGPGPEEARKMMDAFMSEMNARGAGVVWPGGRIWFGGNDCGAPGGSCRDGDAAGFDARGAAAQDPPAARLPVDIVKEADAYTVIADIPGVSKAELTIKLLQRTARQPATLTIAGRRAAAGATAAGEEGQQRVLRERRGGPFERKVPLPDDAATSGITARVKDGILTVRVPRVQPAPEQAESEIPIV